MLAFIAGAIPLLTKGVQQFFKGKKEKRDQAFELKKVELEFQSRKEIASATANAEALKAEMEAKKQEWEYEKERVKSIAEMQKVKTGIKWIDASINLVRALFGYGAVVIFLVSAWNLWVTGNPLLTQAQFSETFFVILFYFFAERSAKKAFGN
jgi:hypothetical protein